MPLHPLSDAVKRRDIVFSNGVYERAPVEQVAAAQVTEDAGVAEGDGERPKICDASEAARRRIGYDIYVTDDLGAVEVDVIGDHVQAGFAFKSGGREVDGSF